MSLCWLNLEAVRFCACETLISKYIKMFMQITVLLSIINHCSGNSTLNLTIDEYSNFIYLPRFWTGSGLSPSAPLPFNRTYVARQLLTDDMFINMEYVASLPNSSIKYIRIHWLLSLIVFKYVKFITIFVVRKIIFIFSLINN